ncbi:MAG: c-type cytochrome [Desulfobulbaceae bacterium]|nr:c-type cytochrome [Desulfobulbaceae bacterium]
MQKMNKDRKPSNRFFLLFSALVLTLPATGCDTDQRAKAPAGEETLISGVLQSADNGPVAGMIAIEEGRLYGKNYRYGGKVDSQGRFTVKVPRGGDYALHLYATGYIYHPVAVEIEGGRENSFTFSVPPNPALEEAPEITGVNFIPSERKKSVEIRLAVHDPNDDLSHQILGVNTSTGESFIFSPPGLILPWQKDYPNGTYTLVYETGDRPFSREEWLFVTADNRCYNSAVLGFPFTAEGVVEARQGSTAPAAEEQQTPGAGETGEQVFEKNCTPCHYRDKTEWKVGPGLQGLFQRQTTPALKQPVTEENIRQQIVQGGKQMPPYSHIQGEKLQALLEYLRTL